jgi:hypothetical protein
MKSNYFPIQKVNNTELQLDTMPTHIYNTKINDYKIVTIDC